VTAPHVDDRPVDAQDFDDAISVMERDHEYVVWVHIADVTHYVHPESAMWDAAVDRGNTIYLPAYTVHMLPPVLAETVCSLVPQEDRLAHRRDAPRQGRPLYRNIEIYKSVIHSNERLTYTETEDRLDEPDAPLHDEISLVYELADQMHEQRKEEGSLVLNPRRDRAHTIIEECMLKANKAVTHELMWDRGVEAVYRVHPSRRPTSGTTPSARFRTRRRLHPRGLLGRPAEGGQRHPRTGARTPAREDPVGGDEGDAPREVHERPVRRAPRAQLRDIRPLHQPHPPDERPRQPLDRLPERRPREPHRTLRPRQRQKAGESAEREYRNFLEEVGLDPDAVNNRGIRVVEEDGDEN